MTETPADYWRRAVALIRLEKENNPDRQELNKALLPPNTTCPTCTEWAGLTATLVGLAAAASDEFDYEEWINWFTPRMDQFNKPLDEPE
jgi:hypothetical protein